MAYPKMAEKAAEKQGTVTSKEFAGALKSGGKMAAEELLMSVIPIARIGKLAKLIKGLGEGGKKATKAELKVALEKSGFKKLASVEPDLKSVEAFITKRKAKSGRRMSRRGHRSGDPVTRAEQEATERLGSGHGFQGDPSDLFKLKLRKGGKGAKALRKAAEAKVKRLDSFKYLKGHSRFEMGAGAKKLDAIPGLKYIDPEDAGPEARNTLAFLKDHKGGADYRLVGCRSRGHPLFRW